MKSIWIDVGARGDDDIFAMARKDPGLIVYAFDPDFLALTKWFGRLANFVALPLAVSEVDGFATLHLVRCRPCSSLLPISPAGRKAWRDNGHLLVTANVVVPTIRLDTFMDALGIQQVDFLKVDAQGSDLAIVRSCGERLGDIAKVQMEVAITPLQLYRGAHTKDEICTYMADHGFVLKHCRRQSQGQEEHLAFERTAIG